MLPEKDLVGEIRKLLSEKLLVEVESPDTDLLEGGILDSLTLVQLLVLLEEHFGLTVAMHELEIEDLRSIYSIARLVASQAGSSQAPERETEQAPSEASLAMERI
jgi:acyl carrier protein